MKQEKTWKHFHKNPITHTTAHYLMTISDLKNESGYARVTDIAKKLNISVGSCHTTLQTLKKKKLLSEDANKFFSLTKLGEKLVKQIEQNDNLLVKLFRDVIGIEADQAEIDACKIEHLLSHETSAKLLNFINFVEKKNLVTKKFLDESSKFTSSCSNDVGKCIVCERACVIKNSKSPVSTSLRQASKNSNNK
jgi:Mn-dependent DtxR family transcriptional regulator